MNTQQLIKTSKFMSLILRHEPEAIGLVLDEAGWANVEDLIQLTQDKKLKLNRELIEEVVRSNDKQRFTFSKDGKWIRANQGHSIQVELDLEPMVPPEVLYHGTATRFLDSIMVEGLTKQNRQHVHLSAELETASKVGVRHGKLIILKVDTAKMHAAGHEFYCSKNGVWLTDTVPAEYLIQL